ncbi:MAG: HNH endonuclease signature motif containing protein [Acidimicrobiales bacterium]
MVSSTKTPRWTTQLDAAVASVESLVDEVPDAATMVEALVPYRRRLDAAAAKLAARAGRQQAHHRSGDKDEAAWLANTTGVSKKQASETLDTQRRLEKLPTLRDAVDHGRLSVDQANLVARAGQADPDQQRHLLDTAQRESLKGLKDECERVIAAADKNQKASHERVRRNRNVRFWKDPDGTHCLLAKGTADDIGVLRSRLRKETTAIFDRARREGRREPYEAYRFDALMSLTSGQGEATPPKRDLLFLIDYSAAKRGYTVSGETCEIAGVGPVPVEVALDFDADPFIKAVIRDGTEIKTVVHFGRHVPAELLTALEAQGRRCAVPGCPNDAHLEIDHSVVDHADGGPLALWNTQFLCTHHHRQKTLGLLEIEPEPPCPPDQGAPGPPASPDRELPLPPPLE